MDPAKDFKDTLNRIYELSHENDKNNAEMAALKSKAMHVIEMNPSLKRSKFNYGDKMMFYSEYKPGVSQADIRQVLSKYLDLK